MDKSWKHYAEWNMLITKSHILYDSICRKCPQEVKSIRTESGLVVSKRLNRGIKEEWLQSSVGFLSEGDKNVSELDSGDWCRILWLY